MKKILLIIYCLLFIVWTQAQSPGGVSSNLAGWYSADVSANATTWTDRSPAGNNLTGAGTPTFTNLLNFNRVATFNGSSQRFSLATTSASWPGTNTANTYYYVATPTGANASRSVFGKGTGTTATNGLHTGKGSTATTLVSGATPAGTVSKTLVWAQNVPEMIRTGFNGGTTGAHYISDNGTAETSAGSSNPSYAANSAFAIGSQNTAAGFWDGDVAEVIAYSGKHTAADFNRVESYLAMKYGITKASNYVNSAGTTIWTSGGGYDNNIAGIGRDDMGGSANNGLNQKQSQSQNSGLQPVIGNVNITDTNVNNTNTFSTDLSALVWGSDTGSTSFATSFVFGGLNNRMARIWRVQETGTVGTVKVALPANQITANLSSLSLVVSVDATFDGSDTRTAMTLETLGGIQYYTATVDFTSGQFFTFASLVTAPGGVISGLNIWFDASTGTFSDNGITPSVNNGKVAQWNNRTNNPNFLSVNQSNATRQPDYKTGYVNFNPAIEFFGSSTANQESLIRNGLVSDLFTSNANSSFMLWRAATGVLSTTNYTNTANRYDFYASNTGQFGGNFISTTGTLSTWNITSFVINSTANLGSVNGGSPYSSISRSVDLNTAVTADFALGGRPDGQFFDTSYIPEFINYTRVLTNSELNRVNSYLSLKYGTTLGTASNLVNYTSSDGSTIFWTGNATYQNNIAGIVRDDASALNQKQSQSVNSGLQPVIGNVNITDTNANNTNTFSTDLSALVWGSDTGSTSFATSFVFGGLNNRMARIWRVQETGTVGTVKVALPASQIPANLSLLSLVVSADATFDGSDTRTAMTLETLGGVQYYTATVDFTSGQFFSFAAFVTAPGGVLGSSLWLKADAGVYSLSGNITSWLDQTSTNTFTITNTIQTGVRTINFNNVAYFDGSDYMTGNTAISFKNGYGAYAFDSGNGGVLMSGTTPNNGNNSYFFSGQNLQAGDNTADGNLTYVTTTTGIGFLPVLVNMDIISGLPPSSTLAYLNGGRLVTQLLAGTGNMSNHNSIPYIGRSSDNSFPNIFAGKLGDLIMYPGSHTNVESQRINTYLAIKYGITLSRNNDGDGISGEVLSGSILEGDYVASDGATRIWNSDAIYQNNIAGIMRDDTSGLTQKQSQSVNSGLQPVIGNVNIADTNANNTNNFSADLSSLVWGSDTGSASFGTSFVFGGLTTRMTRIWRVQETGTVGTVKVALPASQVAGNISSLNLVVSADATFDGSDTRIAMILETLGGVQYYTATVDFISGQFFSFAALATAPGGVLGSSLWLKADAGTSSITDNTAISQWNDQSGTNNNATQGTISNQPVYRNNIANNINFNPIVNFDGTNHLMNLNLSLLPTGTTARSLFTSYLYNGTNPASNQIISWGGTASVTGSVYGMRANPLNIDWGNIAQTAPVVQNSLRIAAHIWDGSGNTSRIWSSSSLAAGPTNITANTSSSGTARLGANNWAGLDNERFAGRLPELIVYPFALNTTQRVQVESYLAIKYGSTLGTDATPVSYLASNGVTTFWTGDTAYQNNIAGIARDDFSGLNQKQSASQNSGIQPVIGNVNITDTNANNTNNFSTDLSALVWGSDTGSTSFATSFVFGGLNNRMARIWKIQETGTVGTVKIALPASQILGNLSSLSLVVSADATFDGTDARTSMTLETLGGVQYYTATVDFATGQFFTFAAFVTSPGGVLNPLVWLRGDIGLTGSTTWLDQSGNGKNLRFDISDCSAPASGSLGLTRTLNFNKVADFVPDTWGMIQADVSRTGSFNADVAIVYDADNTSTYDLWGTDTGVVLEQRAVTTNQVANDNTAIFYNGGNSGNPTINLTSFNGTTANGSNVLVNGNTVLNFTGGTSITSCNIIRLGDIAAANSALDGVIGEFVAFNRNISTLERIRLNTYLAIKYGTSLPRNVDGDGILGEVISGSIVEGDYLASDGTTRFWNSDAAYQNNVAGIARDDFSALNQKQSQSVNSGTQVVIGNGSIAASNAVNTNNFAADKSALVWGDNGLPLTYITSVNNNIPSGLNFAYRMSRIWRVQETGTVGTVKVAMRAAAVAYGENAYIIVSSDPTFASGNTWYPLTTTTTINGVTHYTADIDFTSGQYFTFGAKVIGPGGVPGSSLWLRADKAGTYTNNAAVNNWDDVSVNDNDVIQNTAANQPLYKDNTTDNINFNPVMDFDGSNDVLTDADGILGTTTYSNASAFVVNTTKVASNSNVFLESLLGSGVQITMHTPWSDGNVYWDGANNSRIFTAWGGTLNTPYLWTGWNNNSLTPKNSLRRNGLQLTSGNALINYTGNNSPMNIGPTYNGKIGEVVFNTNALSVNERQRVESYLAVKYGFTLDQTIAQNYLNSASAVIWNATTNTGYNNNIAGIMRDDASGLTQKQSQSVNSGLQPVIGNVNIADTNANNTNSFAADLSSLVWGSDTGSTSFATSFVFGGLTVRMTRIWKVQETGTVGTVKVALPASQVTGNISSLNLVVSADATFDGSDTRTAMTLETLGGVQYYTATVDFATGQFFSFAAIATAPGGVFGTTSWFKSDADVTLNGSTVSSWKNQSANANLANLSQATALRQPSYSSNGWNFNPSITYDGTSDILESTFPSMLNVLNATNNEMFGALSVTGGSGARVYFQISDNGGVSSRLSLENTTAHFPTTSGFITNTGLSQTSSLPSIINFSSGSGNLSYAINGNTAATGTFSGSITAGGLPRYMVGGYNAGGSYANFTSGNINEVVTYDKTLTTTERQRVQSYLAIKYGLTLDQTTPQNYLASNSTVIWNAATSTGFNNNIFGILRDDVSTLHQRISKSMNSGSVLTLSTDTNFTNANSTHAAIGTDLQSLVIGETTGAYTFTGTAVTVSGITFSTTEAMAKRWKVQDTGGISCINLRFDATSLPALSGNERYYLIVSDNANFTSNVVYRAVTRTGNNIDVSVNFRDNNVSYFTLAKKDLGISGGDLTDVKSGISTIPSAAWKPTLPNTYLEINSNSKGLVVSRVASTAAIVNPIEGMIIYDLSDNTMKVYTGTIWRKLGDYSTGSNGNINIFCN